MDSYLAIGHDAEAEVVIMPALTYSPQFAKSGEIVETLGSTQVMQEKFPVAGL